VSGVISTVLGGSREAQNSAADIVLSIASDLDDDQAAVRTKRQIRSRMSTTDRNTGAIFRTRGVRGESLLGAPSAGFEIYSFALIRERQFGRQPAFGAAWGPVTARGYDCLSY